MTYKCNKCKKHVKANDGRLLHLLSPHIRETYPVLPRYAQGQFHLRTDLSDAVDSVMKTYGNAEFVSRQMVAQQGRFYERKALSYLSMDVIHPYPDYEMWRQDVHPPTPETIRTTYFNAEYSSLQPYGYCNVERYVRELQGVNVTSNDIVTFDHTFQVLKTYHQKDSAKAVFTGMKGSTKEVISLAAVPSTALREVTHLLKQSKTRRETFNPSVVYTDTCPNGTYVWKGLFGNHIDCRLGLFHFVHRIVETLDNKSELYWKCMVEFKHCIYTYHDSDYSNLMQALRTGTLSSSRQPMNEDEISTIRHSKQGKGRYDQYLRKVFHSETDICSYLEEWIRNWDHVEDSCGRRVFSSATIKSTREQMRKVKYVLDSEKATIYSPVAPKRDSSHNLTIWKTNRPESALEKFHEQLAHYGNGAMRKEYADALIYRGTAEYNIVCRHKQQNNQRLLDGVPLATPKWQQNVPTFWDHSILHFINQLARSKGFLEPFKNCETPKANNGEVFLSDYCIEQTVRNNNNAGIRTNDDNQLCVCTDCTIDTVTPLLQKQAALPVLEETQRKQMLPSERQHHHLSVTPRSQTTKAYTQPMITLPPVFVKTATVDKFYCMPFPPYRCQEYTRYLHRKHQGEKVLGRPPHSHWCLKACPAAPI